jgi:hypothetical protein
VCAGVLSCTVLAEVYVISIGIIYVCTVFIELVLSSCDKDVEKEDGFYQLIHDI